jgi:hypothetical protein
MAATRAAAAALSRAFRGYREFLPDYTIALVRPSPNPMRPRPQPTEEDLARPKGPLNPPKRHQPRQRQYNDVVFRVDMKCVSPSCSLPLPRSPLASLPPLSARPFCRPIRSLGWLGLSGSHPVSLAGAGCCCAG